MTAMLRYVLFLVLAFAVSSQARREGKPVRQRQRHRQNTGDSLNDEAGGTCELEISCKNYDGSMPVKLPIKGPRGPTGSPGNPGEKGDPGEPGMPGIPGGAVDVYPTEDPDVADPDDSYNSDNYNDEDGDDDYYDDYEDIPEGEEDEEEVDESELLTILKATLSPNSIFIKDPKKPQPDGPTRTVKYKNLTITVPSHLRVTGKEDEEYDEYIDGLMEMESDGSSIYKAEKAPDTVEQDTDVSETKEVKMKNESGEEEAEKTGVAASKGGEKSASMSPRFCLLEVLSAFILAVVLGP